MISCFSCGRRRHPDHAHARRRRLWRQVCDAAVHTTNYVARHKPGRAGHHWTWESKAIAAFYAVAGPVCITLGIFAARTS